ALGDDGAVRVLALRESADGPDAVSLTVAGAPVHAPRLIRLHGRSLDATTGVTLGGQTWDGSTDGAPRGALQTESLARAGAGGSFARAPYAAVLTPPAP